MTDSACWGKRERGWLTLWHRNNVTHLEILDRKVDDGGVLLDEEIVLGEAL